MYQIFQLFPKAIQCYIMHHLIPHKKTILLSFEAASNGFSLTNHVLDFQLVHDFKCQIGSFFKMPRKKVKNAKLRR